MTNKTSKSEKLKEILSSSWSTLKRLESGVKITGMMKDDYIEISDSEIKLVSQFLKSDDTKIRIGAIEILGEFGELSNNYIKDIIKDFQTYSVKEQQQILTTLQRIAGEEILEIIENLIDKNLDYDILLEIAFIIGINLSKKPNEGMKTLLKLAVNKHFWEIILNYMRSAYNRATQPDKFKGFIAIKMEEPPLIGISAEGQRRRDTFSSVESNIDLAISKLVESEKQDKNKKERSDAKKTLELIWKKIK
ncbi:MAG: hypothetical protein EAX90_07480 [Candidatus Heimdallarchaeota archaeon]|nr:hypothetical protein [Candidatus Heimdallarchaeota archaeon]